VQVDELAPGLWRWTAEHPEWKQGAEWEPEVACFYAETDAATLLVDPLVPVGADTERFWSHLDADVERRGRPVAVLLTGEWHRRSTDEVAARYGALVHDGDELPGDVVRLAAGEAETALWLPAHRALAVGDALISVGGELRLWCARSPESLAALLELPVEHVLVAHGDHVRGGRAALAAALEREPYGV
jgi:glyoxylase-like metal-dependent hydrolase (beta-lactamase superfamily II)